MRMFQKIMTNSNIKTRIPFPIFDVYYFNWQPFVRTKVHDHAENGCLMVLMKGELNEKLYNTNLEIIGENNSNNDLGFALTDSMVATISKFNGVIVLPSKTSSYVSENNYEGYD